MKKEEFIKKLQEKLDILDKNEIKDIIEEYSGYIDEKMQNGASEEEAIKDFGDIDELATELLKAYKINVDKNKKSQNWITTIADKIMLWIDRIVKIFSNKSASEILKILIELFFILLAVGLCKIPFYILEELGYNVFNIFANNFGKSLFRIWKFLIEFVYLIFGVVLFAKIFEKRYMTEDVEEISTKNKKEKKNKMEKENKIVEKKDIESKEKKGLLDFLSTMCLWFIKFIVFWILFGVGCYILGMSICLGFCIFLLIKGVTYFGIYLSIIALLLLGIISFILMFNFIVDKKNHIPSILISFLVSFILLGIGFSYASVEIATTTYINDVPDNYEIATLTETIPMNESYILFGSDNYEIDESLKDEIKITYDYFEKFYTLKTDIEYRSQNRIYLNSDYTLHVWNNEIIDSLINDLKNKTIHNYSMYPKITIYSSSENIAKLKDNKSHWNRERRNYNQEIAYDNCMKELERYGKEKLSSYCEYLLYEEKNELKKK